MARPSRSARRHLFQALWALGTNAFLVGSARGTIYSGRLKALCVPGLNCYSCPGALGSCPLGALQATLGSYEFQLPLYISGFLMLVGTVLGRFVCGFLCPFGMVQELLYRIPFPKKWRSFPADPLLRYLKYFILVVFVLVLPFCLTDLIGQGYPWFCKLLCPAGTLEGGIPLLLSNETLRSAVGLLFAWKIGFFAVLLLLSMAIFRPFCRYLCPLGAIYAFLSPLALLHYERSDGCNGCGTCSTVCPMAANPKHNPNPRECIRCGACLSACPQQALTVRFGFLTPSSLSDDAPHNSKFPEN